MSAHCFAADRLLKFFIQGNSQWCSTACGNVISEISRESATEN